MKQSYWREEPARLSGQIAALLALLAAGGLQISDETTAAITSLGSGVAVLLGAYFLRTKVTSPATVDRLKAAKPEPTMLELSQRIGDIEQLLAAKHDQAVAQNIVQTYATVAAKAKPKRDIGGRFTK